jgi:zinc transport system ATP-binding protein
MGPALRVEDLAVAFGKTVVFQGLTFSVARGTSLAIIGPNGSGKTVLFKALVGSIPHRGRVVWAEGVRIGYVPQKIDIERDLPITGLDLLGAKKAVSGAVENVSVQLRLVGLAPKDAAEPIGALSGGQFQRLLLAVALVGRPDVLLLDEPTASVDEPGQEKLNELVRRVKEEHGLTVLLISHDLSVVYRYANEVLCLSRDRAWFGPPRTILTPELLQKVYGTQVEFHVHGS